jgi:hypothetical protein
MVEIDLSSALEGRVANQEVDMLMIANTVIWEKPSTADGPYYVNDALGITPTAYTDGTPNIVIGHLMIFYDPGFVTGIRWYDGAAGAGDWILSLWLADTVNGHNADIGGSPRQATKTVASTGSGYRDTLFDSPVAVTDSNVYVVSRYNSAGHYVHSPSFSGSHGAYSPADPVYVPNRDENISGIVPGWTGIYPSAFTVGGGDQIPQVDPSGTPYYGLTPIFFKSL